MSHLSRMKPVADDDLESLRARVDVRVLMFFVRILVVAVLLIMPTAAQKGHVDGKETSVAFRPVGVPLRAAISWDADLDKAYGLKPGMFCPKKGDLGFDPTHRPPECSAADVDLLMRRVTPQGVVMFYSTRHAFVDALIAFTPDDRGIVHNADPTTIRAEQMISQYPVLPPGTYTVNADLFEPDVYLPQKAVKVCGMVIYNEGVKDSQKVLFKGCKSLQAKGNHPREATLVSFIIDENGHLVNSSVDQQTYTPIAGPLMAFAGSKK